jgi:small subunit ribosomal protein S4
MCRREGVSLCGKEKCALKRRNAPPGVHGPAQSMRKPRLSSYGIQLREKQKAKRLYNVMERQFRRYFEMATQKKGNTADFLVQILERRLDNVVYRLGLAKTRRQARQMVSHGFVSVNSKRVNIPSYTVQIGETIGIREEKKSKNLLNGLQERMQKTDSPRWISADSITFSGKITSLPEGEDLKSVFDPTLIVEFYSR